MVLLLYLLGSVRLTVCMSFIELVEEVRETQHVCGGKDRHREGSVADAGSLKRPGEDRLPGRQTQDKAEEEKWN